MAALQSPKLSVGVRVPEGTPNMLIKMIKEDKIYTVRYTDTTGKVYEREFDNLTPAMDWAKTLSYFVTITGGEYDIVGKFGVDSIIDGKCPDGVVYDWNKASRIGRSKRR